MHRLIDGDLLMETVFNDVVLVDGEVKCVGLILAETVDKAHTIDAVPVVRCRECKFGSWDSETDDAMVCVRTNDGFWRSGNDFCSRGKRKEGAD